MNEQTSLKDLSVESLLGRAADEFSQRLSRGETPEIEDYAQRYPQIAELIRQVFPALQVLPISLDSRAEPNAQAPPAFAAAESRTLGDFRILREVGRGGMGIVYEAEQISLGRRVALKVFPFAAVLDPRQLQRFKNEAQAAASLKHPGIVHVYSVGCERAVHFYAMEFIEGQTLAEVIGQLSPSRGGGEGVTGRQSDGVMKCRGDKAATPTPTDASHHPITPAPSHPLISPAAETQRQPQALISTEGSNRSPEFFRTVAQLGTQAAEALEHAHAMGVVHRDVKPSNLMVDAQGHLSITDFGLAMTQTDANLTMTGDLLGTLRYMSPEQVEAKHDVLGHRTDVYSLGVTLYELLTLRPAFGGDNRQKLMRRIVEEDPVPPRQINGAIPRDLETIVLKAIAKEPKARYATAGDLGADLRRFIEDKPIRARRPSPIERAKKWARRHRPVVYSAAVLVAAAMLYAGATAWRRHLDRVDLQRAVQEHLAAAAAFSQSKDWSAAGQQVGEARGRLDAAQYGTGPLSAEVEALAEDISAKQRADRLGSPLSFEPDSWRDFRARGIACCEMGRPDKAIDYFAEAIRQHPERGELWGWRGFAHVHVGNLDQAIADYSQWDRRSRPWSRPLWFRGNAYRHQGNADAALADFDRAIHLAPQEALTYVFRGQMLFEMGDVERALADFDRAIAIDPQLAYAHCGRALAQATLGQTEDAAGEFNRAMELDPAADRLLLNRIGYLRAVAWFFVMCPEVQLRRPARAVELATRAIELSPMDAKAWTILAAAEYRRRNFDAASAALDEAAKAPSLFDTAGWFLRAMLHWQRDEHQQARRWYDKAVERMEKTGPRADPMRRLRAEAAELIGTAPPQKGRMDPAER